MPTTLNSIMAESQVSTANNSEAAERAARGGGGAREIAASSYSFPCGEILGEEDPPTRPEVMGWYAYGLCSYFVLAFLLPVLFPLMVAQRAAPPPAPPLAAACRRNENFLYQTLVHRSIGVNHSKLSPLHWTAISWFIGVVISAPIIPKLAQHLDHSYHQPLIIGAGTSVGAFICLLTGFFKTTWLFPFYIAIITVSIISASSVHTRHLALIVRGLSSVRTHQKTLASSRMSLSATAIGSLATAVIALFTFHMLRRADHLTSLWVVSIFCGLKWFLGFTETFFATRPGSSSAASITRVSNYWPRLIGRLSGVFLSSFSSTCIFTSATLYIAGSLCMKPALLLAIWMVYFVFAAISLPALHPVQLFVCADPIKMNLLGFMLSAVVSGCGFYFKDKKWHFVPMLFVALVQSTGAGIMHSYSRVMILDRAPRGNEGVFSSWYEWVKMSGACAGFALAAVCPNDIRKTFGISFLAVFVGVIVLIFGSDVRNLSKGLHDKDSEGGSSGNGLGKGGGDQSKEYIGSGERKMKQVEGSVQV